MTYKPGDRTYKGLHDCPPAYQSESDPDTIAAALNTLTRLNALDLADMLGLEVPEQVPA